MQKTDDRFENPNNTDGLPRIQLPLKRALLFFDSLFDRLLTSKYNLFYRSGTLAVYCLLAALVTGFYLIFFYRVSAPYFSITEIQAQQWGGRWIRAMHRWVSDVAVLAVIVHVVRLLVQGRTWGQRLLAWLTGVFLTLLMFISAWTGYVMVWDEHGLVLARMGAQLLDQLKLFPDNLIRSFTGDRPVLGAFFFMNLFLHVAIPLGMVVVLWLHTFKLARSKWLPEKRITIGLTILFIVFSILVSAPLLKEADPFSLPGRFPTDMFYNFWMPIQRAAHAEGVLALFLLGILAVSSIPWWWRPRLQKTRQDLASKVEKNRCQGCSQCYQDCPYDAILMMDRSEAERPPLYADVDSSLCTSCGICMASCSSLAIGPPGRTGHDMLREFHAISHDPAKKNHRGVLFVCEQSALAQQAEMRAQENEWLLIPVTCVGAIHTTAVATVLRRYGQAAIAGCAEGNCMYREGPEWLQERLDGRRSPELPNNVSKESVFVFHGSPHEAAPLWAHLAGGSKPKSRRISEHIKQALTGFSAVGVLSLVAWGSQWQWGEVTGQGALRLSWKLPGQKIEKCRDLTADELSKKLPHMRVPKECKVVYIDYRLRVQIDGEVAYNGVVTPAGIKHDRPLDIYKQFLLDPGVHQIQVEFVAADHPEALQLAFSEEIQIEEQRVALVGYDSSSSHLKVLSRPSKEN